MSCIFPLGSRGVFFPFSAAPAVAVPSAGVALSHSILDNLLLDGDSSNESAVPVRQPRGGLCRRTNRSRSPRRRVSSEAACLTDAGGPSSGGCAFALPDAGDPLVGQMAYVSPPPGSMPPASDTPKILRLPRDPACFAYASSGDRATVGFQPEVWATWL